MMHGPMNIKKQPKVRTEYKACPENKIGSTGKKKIYCSLRVLNHVRTDRRLIAINTELSRIKINYVVSFSLHC